MAIIQKTWLLHFYSNKTKVHFYGSLKKCHKHNFKYIKILTTLLPVCLYPSDGNRIHYACSVCVGQHLKAECCTP